MILQDPQQGLDPFVAGRAGHPQEEDAGMGLSGAVDQGAEVVILGDDHALLLDRPTQDRCVAEARVHIAGKRDIITRTVQRRGNPRPTL